MGNLLKLPAWTDDGKLVCVVESPRGSKAKFKYDPTLKAFTLNKPLIAGLTYPYDWGFVPGTLADDGDPLDVLMFHDVPTACGIVLLCRPIGALLVTQKSKQGEGRQANHRLLAVPVDAEREKEHEDARELPKRLRKELEQFFIATAALADKALQIVDWVGPKEARELVDEGIKRLQKSK